MRIYGAIFSKCLGNVPFNVSCDFMCNLNVSCSAKNFVSAMFGKETFFSNLVNPKSNFDCNYNFSINLAPNEIPFDKKTHRKSVITIQIWFGLTKLVNLINLISSE